MDATSIQTPASVATDYTTWQFMIQQRISQIQTAAMVTVVAVTNAGGVSPVGSVDVRILVNQQTSNGTQVPHSVIHDIPYFRIQGGANAVILDPVVGDIGVCLFCSRDIQSLKADPQGSVPNGVQPGSAAQFAYADGLYIGGFLNAVPAQYVAFAAAGITIVSPTKITLQAPEIDLNGAVKASSTIVAINDVTGQATSLHNHVHSGVQSGGSNTGPPV